MNVKGAVLQYCAMIYYLIGATALRSASFGQGIGEILLDNLRCTGTETRLVDCPHNGIGIDNCAHSEDAGLRCAGKYRILYNNYCLCHN